MRATTLRVIAAIVLAGGIALWGGLTWTHRAAAWNSGYLETVPEARGAPAWITEVYERLRGVAYFRKMAADLTRGARTDRERIDTLLEWTYMHVRAQFAAPSRVIADDPYRIVKRGFGYCDQSAHVFSTLANEAGLEARLYFLRAENGVTPHAVAQVRLDGKWIFVDTLVGRVVEVGGVPLTLEAIRATPELVDVAYEGARDLLPISAGHFLRGEPFFTFYGVRATWRNLFGRSS